MRIVTVAVLLALLGPLPASAGATSCDPAEVGIVATFEVAAGDAPAFEARMGELIAAVRENEPGNLLYRLYRAEDGRYVMMERYASAESLARHGESEHFGELFPQLRPLLAAPPEITRLTPAGC